MKTGVRIIILTDNVASRSDLLAEHGLSLWIEYGTTHILWDTGQSDILLANAKRLGIDLSQTDIIALSHGHYDHTGGLPAVAAIAPNAVIYAHPEATIPRYSKKESVHPVGMPPDSVIVLNAKTVKQTSSWTQVCRGVFLTGPIPRLNMHEDTGGAFFLDADCRKEDMLPDDQALVMESEKGLIVILGCAHSGTINTLDYISHKTGQRKIHAIVGGMHLGKASQQRLDCTVNALKQYDVKIVIPLHCTGSNAIQYLKNALSDKIVQLPQSPYLELK
jgi:7,8-dihydropterin-6-yl-methyl-4-(beta-D-ribofuranosyl)aminobenzene 5'-phosphate synthase